MSQRKWLGEKKRMFISRYIKGGYRLLRIILGQEKYYRIQERYRTVHLGSEYGGWTFCPDLVSSESVVYSIGIGNDITFDTALISRYKTDVYAFDPTPASIKWLNSMTLPVNFHFHPYAVGITDGIIRFYEPLMADHTSFSIVPTGVRLQKAIDVECRRVSTIMQELGHKRVDLLKMDVEGAEYDIIENLLEEEIPVSQLLVEFHHRFANIGFKRTQCAIEKLQKSGFRIVSVSPNGEEYSFINNQNFKAG